MSQSQQVKEKTRKCRKVVLVVFCLFSFFSAGYGQVTEWKYIARSKEGRYYIKTKIDSLIAGNRGMWMKIVSDDSFEQISYSEWDCKNQRFRIKQTSSYAPDGTTIEQLKNLDWAYVSPETVSEDLIGEACGTPREIKYAIIILNEVKLRDAPSLTGQVYRTARLNDRFPLTPFNPTGAWYQIYDPKTLAEYWIHGNSIKIVSAKEEDSKSKKKK